MIYSTMYASSENKIFENYFIHNTIIYTIQNLNKKCKRLNYLVTQINYMWNKKVNIFDVAWGNKFNDKAYANRRRISKRNKSNSYK